MLLGGSTIRQSVNTCMTWKAATRSLDAYRSHAELRSRVQSTPIVGPEGFVFRWSGRGSAFEINSQQFDAGRSLAAGDPSLNDFGGGLEQVKRSAHG